MPDPKPLALTDFLCTYSVRSHNIMWFLGAGASASAGVPTAYDMIWDFKRTLFCASNRVPARTCQDLSDPNLRRKIQRHFDQSVGYPVMDSEEEYSSYFSAVYRTEQDRRNYIDRLVANGRPSYGHLALGSLLKHD